MATTSALTVALFSNQFAAASGHGIARYSRALCEALAARPGLAPVPVAAWTDRTADDLAALAAETGLRILPTGRRATPILWTWAGRPRLETLVRGRVDVVHAAALGYPVATARPYVVTVHDLGPLTHPEYFTNTRPWVMRKSLDQAVRQARAIVCVSQATKDELLDYAGAHLEPRVGVVHEGVARLPQGVGWAAMAHRDLPPEGVPFVLATGKISPRKNILGVMEALAGLLGTLPHHLVIAGGDGWAVDEVYAAVTRLGLQGRIHFPGFVSDAELATLYARADVYVHPSFYEGFGLTVLEAMAAGTPVVTADRSSLPEVAGEAALLVDPGDVDALAQAILRIATDEPLAADLRTRGRARAATFTWEAAAEAMERIYRERM